MTLVYFSVAWVLGIILGVKTNLPYYCSQSALLLSASYPLLKTKSESSLSSLCLFILFCGVFRSQPKRVEINKNNLQFYVIMEL